LKTSRALWASGPILLLFLIGMASAETLTGTVKNGTTGMPAAGDDVVLIKLGQGMEEAGRTKTDAKGNFSFKLGEAGPHLIRGIHQGVTYHRMVPPGTASVELQVYDVSRKLEAVSVTADVMRFQAQGNELQGIRLFAVDNKSTPPRTQMNDQNFEFYLPEGARVDSASAMTQGGQPVDSAPVPQKEKNRYAFIFPLRPGQTLFQVVFYLPYTGQLNVDPRSLYPAQHFVVMVPKTMKFSAGSGSGFEPRPDPRQPDAIVQVVSNTHLGQSLAFKITGTGMLAEGEEPQRGSERAGGEQASGANAPPQGRDSRPGGGLGPPIDAPDPLEKYRWYLLGGFGIVLTGGAIYIAKRSKADPLAASAESDSNLPVIIPAAKPSPDRSNMLLEALKEELFQLEVEHKQGHISQPEYEKAKAALDQTLDRALRRKQQKTEPRTQG